MNAEETCSRCEIARVAAVAELFFDLMVEQDLIRRQMGHSETKEGLCEALATR